MLVRSGQGWLDCGCGASQVLLAHGIKAQMYQVQHFHLDGAAILHGQSLYDEGKRGGKFQEFQDQPPSGRHWRVNLHSSGNG